MSDETRVRIADQGAEAWKAAAHRRQMDQWSEQPGECLKCGLPMRLHPPERSYAAELWMCAKAREASEGQQQP